MYKYIIGDNLMPFELAKEPEYEVDPLTKGKIISKIENRSPFKKYHDSKGKINIVTKANIFKDRDCDVRSEKNFELME